MATKIPESQIDPWQAWFDDFVVRGNNDQSKEKNGTLTFLGTDKKTVLATVKFFNLGMVRIEPDVAESNSDAIARVQVELYVERMEFEMPNQSK